MTKIALYQPDMAGNVGSIIRTIACLGGELHIIGPCGFVFDKQKMKRSAMDYFDKIKITHHDSFDEFYQSEIKVNKARMVLCTTKSTNSYSNFKFLETDVLLFGRESAGVPDEIHHKSDETIKIMMQDEIRSLNLAISVAIILSHCKI